MGALGLDGQYMSDMRRRAGFLARSPPYNTPRPLRVQSPGARALLWVPGCLFRLRTGSDKLPAIWNVYDRGDVKAEGDG
jgi:hypothetical protein